jgi:hypothetical protein
MTKAGLKPDSIRLVIAGGGHKADLFHAWDRSHGNSIPGNPGCIAHDPKFDTEILLNSIGRMPVEIKRSVVKTGLMPGVSALHPVTASSGNEVCGAGSWRTTVGASADNRA